jgi:hypothetical protein
MIKGKKGGLFGFIFGFLGVLVFLVALALIIFVIVLLINYGIPTFQEAIKYVASKGG